MSYFSIYDYHILSLEQQGKYNKVLARKLSFYLKEIPKDVVLKNLAIEEFVNTSGECANAATIISDIYSRISSGIQVGSGCQPLFHGILSAFTESWNEITLK